MSGARRGRCSIITRVEAIGVQGQAVFRPRHTSSSSRVVHGEVSKVRICTPHLQAKFLRPDTTWLDKLRPSTEGWDPHRFDIRIEVGHLVDKVADRFRRRVGCSNSYACDISKLGVCVNTFTVGTLSAAKGGALVGVGPGEHRHFEKISLRQLAGNVVREEIVVQNGRPRPDEAHIQGVVDVVERRGT
jgi:hypothetical protein